MRTDRRKRGARWRRCVIWISDFGVRYFLLPIAFAAASASAAVPERLFAGGSWAALGFGARCEAAARPLAPSSTREPAARAGFAFEPRTRRIGAFFARLSRVPRSGSTVILTIGSQPFLLVASGPWAWGRESRQHSAILAATRTSASMRIEGRDASGRRFTDRYLLDGAPTAIDAAAAACADL